MTGAAATVAAVHGRRRKATVGRRPRPAEAAWRDSAARRRADEGGAGILATMLGALFFCAFLLIALQITTDLYWRTQIRLVAFDAARVAAQAGGSTAHGEALVHQLLGSGARTAWSTGSEAVELTVVVPRASRLVSPWRSDPYTVTVTVHREAFRPSAGGGRA